MACIKVQVILSFNSKNSKVRTLGFHILLNNFATWISHLLFLIYEDMGRQCNRQQTFVVEPMYSSALLWFPGPVLCPVLLLDCSTGSVVVFCEGNGEMSYPQHWLWVSAFGGYHKILLFNGFNTCFSQHWCCQAGPCSRTYIHETPYLWVQPHFLRCCIRRDSWVFHMGLFCMPRCHQKIGWGCGVWIEGWLEGCGVCVMLFLTANH